VFGPTVSLGRHIEKRLATDSAMNPQEPWVFGVIADPHIYMYGWNDGHLARALRQWADAGARFGVVVGDLGTGTSLRPDGKGQTRQMDKFAQTIAAVRGCPPVVLAMGNHEMDGDGKRAWLDALYPGVVNGVEGNGNDRFFYYSFDYRGCHFVCLDANQIVSGKRRKVILGRLPEEELAWLEKDLAANKGKLTFVFLHEPIEQVHYDTPYYLLKNRGRLVGLLRQFPDVQWIFHGHLHYDDHVRAWGLNIVHCGSHIVRVTGKKAVLARVTPKGVVDSARKPYDLGQILARRAARQDGLSVYRVAEKELERPGRGCTLRGNVHLVPAENGVAPTHGKTMIRIHKKLGAREQESFTHLHRPLSTWDVIPIRKGMKFGYDVRADGSVYDNFALALRIALPPRHKRVRLKDQNGVLMENVHLYHSPSLEGRADGKWYPRECDLSPLAGGWIDMITLYCTRPNGAPYPAGELKIYVDNIRFTWPAEGPVYP
jgi:hypothetical protein